MAQHDYAIANQSGSSFRSDLNNALAAVVSQNSGSSEPSTTYAYQSWADTTAGVMKMRNGANNAWITLYQLDGEWSTIAFENGTAAAPSIYFKDSGTDTGIFSPGADSVAISTGSTERARIDSSGRLLVGASSARGIGTSINWQMQLEGTGSQYPGLSLTQNANDAEAAYLVFGKSRGTSVGSNTVVQNNDRLGLIAFAGADGTDLETRGAEISAWVDGAPGANDLPTRLIFSTTADGASSPTERMRITNNGNVRLGSASAYNSEFLTVNNGGGTTTEITAFGGSGGVNHRFYFHNGSAGNAAGTVYWTNSDGSTGRSINAGGTINASGADYAEYIAKAGDFTIAKGDICGVDTNGELTNTFAGAVSFLVKSTNPSYVGNDYWGVGYENNPDGLEVERQKVDRIAFAGQVPVNVTGATPGQYIVPIANEVGGITGIAKDEADLTLAEYMRAVGKVITIEDDGRARIIVKVA